MHSPAEPRFRKRFPCEFSVAGSQHQGLVLNLSRGGLFVQTSVPARQGDDVRVQVAADQQADPIALDARVVWKRVVSSSLHSVTPGGMGLRIEAAPERWYEFLAGAFGADPAPPSLPRFRVRIKRSGGPRSRTLLVHCASEGEARQRALEEAGPDWHVLELQREG